MRYELYDQSLVRKLKLGVRARLKQSRMKRSSGRGWGLHEGKGGRYLWILWILLGLGRGLEKIASTDPGGKTWALSCASLLFVAIVMTQANNLQRRLTVSVERAMTCFYPIEETEFRNWVLLRFVAELWWLLVVIGVIFGVVEYGNGGSWLAASLATGAEYLLLVCLIFLLEPYVDMVPRWLPLGFYAMAGLLFIAPGSYTGTVQPLMTILPTNGLRFLLINAKATGWRNVALAALLPILCLAIYLAVQELFRKMNKHAEMAEIGIQLLDLEQLVNGPAADAFDAQEIGLRESERNSANEESGGLRDLPMQAAWQRQRLNRVEVDWADYIRGRHWLLGWDWTKASWLERVAGWTLNQQERSTAEFLLGGQAPNWSNRWRMAVIATACAFASLLWENELFSVVATLGAIVSIGAGLPLLGGVWPAMGLGVVSGKLAPIHSCYPLDYRSASWTMWKINTVRTLVWAPMGLLLGLLLGHNAKAPLTQSLWISARILLVYLAISPVMVTGKFSKNTNDSVSMNGSRIFLVVYAAFAVSALMGFGLLAVLSGGWYGALALMLTGGVSLSTWALYGWFYGRREVDLLRGRTN